MARTKASASDKNKTSVTGGTGSVIIDPPSSFDDDGEPIFPARKPSMLLKSRNYCCDLNDFS